MNQRSGNAEQIVFARAVIASALALGMLLAGRAAGDDAAGHVWLLSTRRAPHGVCSTLSHAPIDYWRLDAQRRWQPADGQSFLHGDDSRLPTTLFLHGNRDDFDDAVDDGWQLYRLLEQDAGGRPFRLVIWSWPADRIPGRNRRDVQVKASYSDVDALYLAAELHRIDPQTPLCLIGYSFGARIVSGALHVLGGGTLLGRGLPGDCPDFCPSKNGTVPLRSALSPRASETTPLSPRASETTPLSPRGRGVGGEGAVPNAASRRPIRAVLVAAAMDCDWLLPGHRNGLALSQVDQMLITQNCCDRVLKWYPRMYRGRGPEAVGRVGPAWGGEIDKIELIDVTCSVGREHNWFNYLQAPGLRSRLLSYCIDPLGNGIAQHPLNLPRGMLVRVPLLYAESG